MKNKKVLYLTQAAIIVVLYVLLTQLSNVFGLASSLIQVRFSEALCIMALFTPAAIPGLTIGCLLSNLLTGCAIPDILFGSLATLLGAFGTRAFYKLAKRKTGWLFPALLPPILSNTIIIPFVLKYAYGLGPLWLSFVTVFAGEFISCGILGSILYFALRKHIYKIWSE
ncbi:MAG: QueT transporter family protein [Lachnospiraceae bacterium]|nr:QueT transporter family protein [Lachnospiraceae bacterium]